MKKTRKTWTQTPAQKVEALERAILDMATASIRYDRESLRLLPDCDFDTMTARERFGYTREVTAYERLHLLELAGLIEMVRFHRPACWSGPGGRGRCGVWRKTEHGREFERGA